MNPITTYKKWRALPLLLLLVGLPQLEAAQTTQPYSYTGEYTRIIKESFFIKPDGLVDLRNRHGRITIMPHESNSVELEVKIIVRERSEERADRVFDRIDIDMQSDESAVRVVTGIADSREWQSSDFKILYLVRVPATVALHVDARHCDLFIDDHTGSSQLYVKYGDLRANNFENHCLIDLSHGSIDVERLGHTAQLKIAYGEFSLGDVGLIDLNSRYSEGSIGRVSSIMLDMRYGEIQIERAGDMVMTGGYTDVHVGTIANIHGRSEHVEYNIGRVRGSLDMVNSYGDIEIKQLEEGFQTIKIRSEYSDVDMGLPDGYSVDFSGYAAHGSLSVPDNLSINRREYQGSSKSIEGILAGTKRGKGLIQVWTNYGDIDLSRSRY